MKVHSKRMPPRSQACSAPESAEAQHGGQGAYSELSDVSEEIVAGKVPTRPRCPEMLLQRRPSNEETSADESNAGRRQRQHIACRREQLHAYTSREPVYMRATAPKANSVKGKAHRKHTRGSWRVLAGESSLPRTDWKGRTIPMNLQVQRHEPARAVCVRA